MVVGFVGSRALSSSFRPLVRWAVGRVLARGDSVLCGCSSGADEFAVDAALALGGAARLSVLCAFGPGGDGAIGVSSVRSVERAAQAGASVRWWAGGRRDVRAAARLSERTRALVARLAEERGVLVAFPSGPGAARSGTWLAIRQAVRASVRVVVFPCGFAGGLLPSLEAGRWVPCLSGRAFAWEGRE